MYVRTDLKYCFEEYVVCINTIHMLNQEVCTDQKYGKDSISLYAVDIFFPLCMKRKYF